jgi:predicted acylesterase/phospholipase RssA
MSKLFHNAWNLLSPLWEFFKLLWKIFKHPLRVFTAFLKITGLLFPAVVFLFGTWVCFWQLPQGKDILIDMLEKKYMGGIILLSILFWTLVSWYSSRILIYRKKVLYEENEELAFHMPRLIGFLGFSIIWIALLRLPGDAYMYVSIPKWMSWLLLLLSFMAYRFLYKIFKNLRDKTLKIPRNIITESFAALEKKEQQEKIKFRKIYILMGCLAAGLLMLNTVITNPKTGPWLLFFSIIILQLIFLFIVIIRRGRVPFKEQDVFEMPLDYGGIDNWQKAEAEKGNVFTIGIWERILFNANIPQKEKWFFITYNIITLLSLLVYFTTIVNYQFSVILGSFATVLTSFGVLVGFFSLITFASVVLKVNLHMAIWILVIIFGKIFEPHWAKLTDYKEKNTQAFESRPTLYNYFDKWTDKRKIEIEKDPSYPVFFVLADGGASRSGYWTASVLGKLEDTTKGVFSRHLFCLSGASGGSVGNGTFLALLKNREALAQAGKTFTQGSGEYLQSDFLTYTLARTLGPDFIRPIIPLPFINDRAAALEHAMEDGEKKCFLHKKFNAPVSDLIPFTSGNENLPIICINATRMQDGNPSVISTVKLDNSIFGNRIDILNTLKLGKDMKLSTAVVMGARFPYLSPAGRIDSSYYVDGGYFDNSGAGIVSEMIIALRQYIRDSASKKPYLTKLKFYVIHAQNSWGGGGQVNKVHPIINDLAAPVLTLIGAYGTQTSVNDWRLIKYMENIYQNTNDTGYIPVNLYRPLTDSTKTKEEFPMNWVISDYYIKKMDRQLYNVDMKRLIGWMHRKMEW